MQYSLVEDKDWILIYKVNDFESYIF